MPKKVLLIVVDALTSRVFVPALEAGRFPNLGRIAGAGWLRPDCISIFPSITPAATAAIITGGYPCRTGITGAYYYNLDTEEVHFYGDDLWVILREGIGNFFEDFLVQLNRDNLRIETLFDQVESAHRRTACLNYLWFHGPVGHKVHVPWSLRVLPGVPFSEKVQGPTILYLGDLVTTELELTGHTLASKGGMKHRYGFEDQVTADVLVQLAEKGPLPDFTVAYFPDNDYQSHDVGPEKALATIDDLDAALGRLIACWGSVEAMLDEVAVVLVADHSQSDLVEDVKQRGIELDMLLDGFEIVAAGKGWSSDDELMICTNIRAAQIYLRRGYWPRVGEIVDKLLADKRMDQVLWREPSAPEDAPRYRVATADRGTLEFALSGEGPQSATDEYGGRWSWTGDLRCVDGRADESGILRFGDYPNAFERIATAFDHEVSGDLWITAQPGYEFQFEAIAVHQAGAHGSLHALDSVVPLLVAGAPGELRFEHTPRTIDVAGLCLQILGLPVPIFPGMSHADCVESTREYRERRKKTPGQP